MKNKKWIYLLFVLLGGIIYSAQMGYLQEYYIKIVNIKKDDIKAPVIIDTNQALVAIDPDTVRLDSEGNIIPNASEVEINDASEMQTVVWGQVSDDYFDDAAFIGDSRIVGLYDYSGWDNASFYCSSGMRLDGVFGEPNKKFKDGNWTENIGEALQRESYKKIYLMLGINDMGVGDLDYFMKNYSTVIDEIRQWQPDAYIYIMSIMKVTEKRSNQGDYITNEAIDERNEALKALDNGMNTFYLDVNSAVCDEEGNLNQEYTFDGVHLFAQYIAIWTDYLKNNAVIAPQ